MCACGFGRLVTALAADEVLKGDAVHVRHFGRATFFTGEDTLGHRVFCTRMNASGKLMTSLKRWEAAFEQLDVGGVRCGVVSKTGGLASLDDNKKVKRRRSAPRWRDNAGINPCRLSRHAPRRPSTGDNGVEQGVALNPNSNKYPRSR